MCTRNQPEVEARLINRCLDGDGRAWDSLFAKHHLFLRRQLRSLLGPRGGDSDLVEELEQRVWCSLVPGRARLGTYDAARGRVRTFLTLLAQREVELHRRSQRRGRLLFIILSPALVDGTCGCLSITALVEDFLRCLTPRQRVYCETHLLSCPDASAVSGCSPPAARKMRERIFKRFCAFQQIDGPRRSHDQWRLKSTNDRRPPW